MGPSIRRRPNRHTHQSEAVTAGYSTLRSLRYHENDVQSQNILVAEHETRYRDKTKDCTACLASGKSLKHQLPKKHYGKLEKLSKPGQEIRIDFTGKLHNKKLSRRNTNTYCGR